MSPGFSGMFCLHIAAVDQVSQLHLERYLLPVHARTIFEHGCRRRTARGRPRPAPHRARSCLRDTAARSGWATWPTTFTRLKALAAVVHNDVDLRRAHVLGQPRLHVARQLQRSFAHRDHVFDQGRGDLAVRAHRHGHRQFGVTPDEHFEHVAGSDDVVITDSLGGCLRVAARRRRPPAGLMRN